MLASRTASSTPPAFGHRARVSASPARGCSGRRCRRARSARRATRRSRSRPRAAAPGCRRRTPSGTVARMSAGFDRRAERHVAAGRTRRRAPRRSRASARATRGPGSRPGRRGRRSSRRAASAGGQDLRGRRRPRRPGPGPPTDASTAMRRVPASRRIAAGPKVCVISASWPSGIFVPSWPSISSVRIASNVVAAIVAQADDQVEAPLSDPDLAPPPRPPGRCARRG